MANANLTVGTAVNYRETFHGHTWVKVGTVVELGDGRNAGRVRVLWSHWLYPNGHERKDGKRTWMKAAKVTVVGV